MAIAYYAKLKDPRWQKKRLRILERDEWTCQICNSKEKSLHVHHLIYGDGEPWEISDAVLITLCEECHDGEEAVRKQAAEELFESLAMCGIRSAYEIQHIAWALAHFFSNEKSGTENLLLGVQGYCNGYPHNMDWKSSVDSADGK